jgi:hypothetical protein
MALESDSIAGLDRALRADHGLANSLRWLMIVVLGACAALFLAWFMDYLIQSSDMMLSDSKRVRMLDFVRLKRNESAERKDRTPERPKIQETPDVPPLPQSQADASGQRRDGQGCESHRGGVRQCRVPPGVGRGGPALQV